MKSSWKRYGKSISNGIMYHVYEHQEVLEPPVSKDLPLAPYRLQSGIILDISGDRKIEQ